MKLFSKSYGAGHPVILIPGFASGAWSWFRQIEELAHEFRVITFDPRGIGRSKAETSADLTDLSMQGFVEDIRRILDDLKIEKTSVIGASFGGFVAQNFAFENPTRVDKLVLACTSAGGASHISPGAEIFESFTPPKNLSRSERIRKFIRPAFSDEFNAQKADEVERVCRLREACEVAETVYFAQLETALTFDSNAYLEKIANPTLVISGDRDRIVPMENSLHLFEKLPFAELRIINRGSHLFFIENFIEFNRTVKDFLSASE